jgi:hypothetical protein
MLSVKKSLMEWREPKIKGLLSRNSVFVLLTAILVVSLPFGFLHSGNERFSISICLIALAFMLAGTIGFLIQPLRPGPRIELREDEAVRRLPRRSQKSAYKDIDCCYCHRGCSYSMIGNKPMLNVHGQGDGQNFTSIQVILKNETILNSAGKNSFADRRSVTRFAVPGNVDLDLVLKILHDKNVKVVEAESPQ